MPFLSRYIRHCRFLRPCAALPYIMPWPHRISAANIADRLFRPNTPAANMEDNISYKVKLNRLDQLQSKINNNARQISQNMVGSDQIVLVEKKSKKAKTQLAGRTENNRWVNFDGDDSLIGQLIELRITEALPNSLRARFIN